MPTLDTLKQGDRVLLRSQTLSHFSEPSQSPGDWQWRQSALEDAVWAKNIRLMGVDPNGEFIIARVNPDVRTFGVKVPNGTITLAEEVLFCKADELK